jgi:hypothetical protein
MIIGLFLNILGMIGEFASPWFIGAVIDRIAKNDYEGVSVLVQWWMVFSAVGGFFGGL